MKISDAPDASMAMRAFARKRGVAIALVKWWIFGVASLAACRSSLFLMDFIVSQLGASILFILRIEVDLNLKGVAIFSHPKRPKWLIVGFSRPPPTFEL